MLAVYSYGRCNTEGVQSAKEGTKRHESHLLRKVPWGNKSAHRRHDWNEVNLRREATIWRKARRWRKGSCTKKAR